MARQPHITSRGDERVAWRAGAPEQPALLELLWRRYPYDEWATFIRCGWRQLPDGLLLTLAALEAQGPGDLDESQGHVVLQEPYVLRAALNAERHNLAVGVVHSHPQGYAPRPSALDDDMDTYLASYFESFAPGRPYVSLIFADGPHGIDASGRVYWNGGWHSVTRVLLERQPVCTWISGRRPAKLPPSPTTKRLTSAFGEVADERLRRASVGVIGLGGTGSAAVEVLARAGVGRLVLADPDVFEPSNNERIHGSGGRHVAAPESKAAIARDHVRFINPACQVAAYVGRLPQPAVLDTLADVDVLLGCTDLQHSRLALADTARRYLIPALDCGATLEGDDGDVTAQVGQITRFLAADACPYCRGMIHPQRLSQELMSPDERARRQDAAERAVARGERPNPYWNAEPQINTVGYHTTIMGAMTAGYAIGWITGRFDPPFTRLQMNLIAPYLDVTDQTVEHEPPKADCHCRQGRGQADQGLRFAQITSPGHWPREIRLDIAT